ncbi:hypothetical protein HPB47_006402 [Ixodes persulcatus]|uniref:Uncharacterized protein n=1 Tax=Ixodes persulcatus TaxID=34615 RepID=A0AC60PB93_IXOPE|nr:hypothetical protein HPB47_006402 [Ixodes persulcatus]
MSPNDDQFPEDEAYVYDPVDAVRLVRRDWKRRLDASWTPEEFPIPENTFRRHQMVLLQRIRTGGAVTPHHVYRFELTRQRKLHPYYVPPDPRCQRCKDPDKMPSRNFTISFGSAQLWLPSVKQPGLLFFLRTFRRPCKNGRILPATPSAGRGS